MWRELQEKRENNRVGNVRHKNQRLDNGRKRFIDGEAALSGDDSEGDDESDMEDEDLEDLVDDNSDIEDDISMYRTLEQREQAAEIEHLQQRYMEIDNENESDSESDGNETDDDG